MRCSIIILLMSFLCTSYCFAFQGEVINIADGDTITVLHDGGEEKIRLYGIDSPEMSQSFGREAKQFTENMLYGKTVVIETITTDRSGRTVGIVYIEGNSVSEELIKSGNAWVYYNFCEKSICDKWGRLEKEARQSKVGLWSQNNPVAPWDFRNEKRNYQSSNIEKETDGIDEENIELDQAKSYINENFPKIILVALLIVTILAVTLGLTKKVIFYNDYNDLGISLAVFGIPLAMALILSQITIDPLIVRIIIFAVFGLLLLTTIYKTYLGNEKRILPTILVIPAKLVMSFLFVCYIFESFTGKNRKKRGIGWFVLLVFTPLLLALVHSKEGNFRLSRSGRPRFF